MPQLFNHKDKETQRELENVYQGLANAGTGDMAVATYDPNAFSADIFPLNGAGVPSTTPDYIGQTYIDTTAKRWYTATGTASSADWDIQAVYKSGTVTITGGGGDVTVTLPWDWTGGQLEVIKTTATTNYYTGSDTIINTSYDALTSVGYTANQLTYRGNANTVNILGKTVNNNGSPKSATTTSFTLDDSGTTTYVKWFVTA